MATILCVDDDAIQLKLLGFSFKRAGFEVLTASNGEISIDIAKENLPDIILMDLMMPVMDGATATEHLKSDPATAHIPIVLFTAYEAGELAQRALNAGAEALVRKTTPPSTVVDTVKKYLPT